MVTDFRLDEVQRALDFVRPAMEADAGGVEVVAVRGDVVEVRLIGSCGCCPSASLTLRRGILPALQAALPWVADVKGTAGGRELR